jgi:hypothetical protein
MNRPITPHEPKLWTRRSVLLTLAGAGLTVPACDFSQVFSWNGGKPILFGYSTAPNFDKRYKTIKVKIFKDSTLWTAMPVPGLEFELAEYIVHQIEQITPYKVTDNDPDTELSGRIVDFQQIALNYNQLNEIREVETTLTCAVRWKDLRTGRILSNPSPRNAEPPPPAGLLPGQNDPLNGAMSMPGSLMQMELSAAPAFPGTSQGVLDDASSPSNTDPNSPDNSSNGQSSTDNSSNGQSSTNQGNVPAGFGGGPPVAALGTGNGGYQGAVLVRSLGHYRPELGESIATAQQTNCFRMAEQIVNMMEKAW